MLKWLFHALLHKPLELVKLVLASVLVGFARSVLPHETDTPPVADVLDVNYELLTDDILPHIVLTFELERKLSFEEKSRLPTAVSEEFAELFEMWFPITDAFRELVGGREKPYVFEVTVEDGSIILRIAFGPLLMAVILCSYGCGNPRLTRIGYDMPRDVTQAIEHVSVVIEDICTEPAKDSTDGSTPRGLKLTIEQEPTEYEYGAIVDLDDTLDQFERAEITEDECIDNLVQKLEQMKKSDHWEKLVRPLVRYINTRYGELFDWEKLRKRLPEVGRRPEMSDVLVINIATVSVELPSNCTEEEAKTFDEIVREAVDTQIQDAEPKVKIVTETVAEGDRFVTKVWVVIEDLVNLIIKIGSFGAAVQFLCNGEKWLQKRIEEKAAERGLAERINSDKIDVDDRAVSRLRRFLANAGEANASRDHLASDANQLALEVEDVSERAAFRKLVADYLCRKYPDAGTASTPM